LVKYHKLKNQLSWKQKFLTGAIIAMIVFLLSCEKEDDTPPVVANSSNWMSSVNPQKNPVPGQYADGV